MDQATADRLAADMAAIRSQFYSPAEIRDAYGVTVSAVQAYASRAREGKAPLVHVIDSSGVTLIPKDEAERVWGRWQGRRNPG